MSAEAAVAAVAYSGPERRKVPRDDPFDRLLMRVRLLRRAIMEGFVARRELPTAPPRESHDGGRSQ